MTRLYGTAATLNQLRVANDIREEIGAEAALRLLTQAFQRHEPRISREDVHGLMRCSRALFKGGVDVGTEYKMEKQKADRVAETLIGKSRRRVRLEESA